MKLWLAAALGALFLAPLAASAQMLGLESAEEMRQAAVNAHPAECSRLRRQIQHMEMMHSRASTLKNEMWAQRMKDRVNLLRGIQAGRCPSDVPVDTTAEALKMLLKLAAMGAITYFTFGAGAFMF